MASNERVECANIVWTAPESDKSTPYEMDGVTNLLFQFQTINFDWFKEKYDTLIAEISAHLQEFGKINKDGQYNRSYDSKAEQIAAICKEASPKLKDGRIYSGNRPIAHKYEQRTSMYQTCWLTNICRLLPQNDKIIEVLPYLLTCYSINARRNRADPFLEVEKESCPIICSWTDIFPDRLSKEAKARLKEDIRIGGNRTSNRLAAIKSICEHFVRLPNRQYNAFLYEEGASLYTGISYCKKLSKMKPIRADSAYKQYLKCWEQYRWFACFCDACAEMDSVNITLSMALFSALWDKSCICYPLCNNCTCAGSLGKSCLRFEGMPWEHLQNCQITKDSIVSDEWRTKILKALAFNDEPSIEDHL